MRHRSCAMMNTIDVTSTINKENPHFPIEGLCIGSLTLAERNLPALIDLFSSKGTCFLYDSLKTREEVNQCLERIAWRVALSVPTQLCEFLIYNGGNPGENFNTLNKLHKSLFRSSEKVLFDANTKEFTEQLSSIYKDLATRIGAIKDAEKSNLYELNIEEGSDAKIKYTFIFISDFPHITEEQERLLSKIVSADCSKSGVFVFTSWDVNAKDKNDYGIGIDYREFLDSMTLLFPKDDRFYFRNSENDTLLNKFNLKIGNERINIATQNEWIGILNSRIEKSAAVSVDIREKALTPATLWSKTSKNGLEIPIGNISSTTPMNIEFCPKRDSTLVHGLIGGTSGSGKSTLLHDIIINGAWLYSPDELQFVLLDFKSVEFGIYSSLPHVRVLSTKSDREYGSNVLAYITKEIENRKKLFGRVSSIEEYNNDKHHVPRLLVIIDEFHNMFVSEGVIGDLHESNITLQINKDFNKILKEGRSFGVHLLLATQEAGGIQSIDSYLQLLKLRIALKMEVKGKFLAFDNTANPDRLKRGEGIYNDDFGKDGSNHPFRFTFYGNENMTHKQVIEAEMMEPIRRKSIEVYKTDSPCEKCFYRGGGESIIEDNTRVATQINDEKCVVYVGSPVTVSNEDVFFELRQKRGANIILVGANSDYLESLVSLTFEQIIKQSRPESQFMMCLSSNDDFITDKCKPNAITLFNDNQGLETAVQATAAHVESRQKREEQTSDRIVLAIIGLRYFDVISRNTDIKNQLENIITKGPEVGIHVLLHSAQLSDFEKTFKQDFSAFGSEPSVSPEELLREFNIKIELKGVDGHHLYEHADRNVSPQKDFLANIQTKESGEITKFSIYQQ